MPVTVTHAKSNTIADFTGTVTVNNSSGGTNTALATDLVRPSDWNSAHQVTLNLTGSEIASMFSFGSGLTSSTNATGVVVGLGDVDFYEPFPQPNTNSTVSAPGIGTWYIEPVAVPFQLQNGLIHMPVVGGASTNWFQDGAVWSATLSGSNTRYATNYNKVALYRRGTGASTTRLETVWTNEMSWLLTWERRHSGSTTSNATISQYLTISIPSQFNTAGAITYGTNTASGTTSYGASTAASTIASGLLTGPMRFLTGSRFEVVPLNTTINAGDYFFAHMFTSSTSVTGTNYTGGTVYTSQSRLGLLENNLGAFKRIGNSTTDSTSSPQIFHGYLATTSSNASSVIASSDIRSTTGRAYWNFAQTAY